MTSQVPIRTYNQHRDEYIIYSTDGTIQYEAYYLNNQCHCDDSPAVISYYADGTIQCETYYQNGHKHRDDGPAFIKYNENGTIEIEEYYHKGNYHREDGPAFIKYNENGVAVEAIGYIDDKETNVLYDLNVLYNHRTPIYKPVL